MKSWKTTLAGLLVFVGVLITQYQNTLDADPTTVFSWEAVVAAFGVFVGLFFARDKNVTSEEQNKP